MEVSATVNILLDRKGSELWFIAPEATVYEAIALMAEKNIGALPVMKGDRLLGMISERDYTRKVILMGRASRDTAVSEIMVSDPVTVGPHDSVHECMELMTEHRIRHLPVLDGNRLLGIVSIGDVVFWTIGAQSVALEDMERFVMGVRPV